MKKQIVLALLLVVAIVVLIPAVARSPQVTPGTSALSTPCAAIDAASLPAANAPPASSPVPPPAPTRDLFDLTLRLRPDVKGPIPQVVNKETPQYEVGQKQTFWLTDLNSFGHFAVNTTLRYISPHAYFYVEDGADLTDDEIQRGANDFENHVLPSDRKYFGTEWIPGVDNDPRLSIVAARFPGAAGYYSMSDEYPKVVNPYSNEREIIYIGLPGLRPGTPSFAAVMAHEYEHAIHWHEQPNQETWISEGSAELASSLAGFSPVGLSAFLSSPDTQLTGWTSESGEVHRFYGVAYLFMKYLFEHYGGFDSIHDFLAEREPGARGINTYLKKKGFVVDFDGVFKNWVIANYLDEPGNGCYSYPNEDVKVAVQDTIKKSADVTASVSQYGADYYDIQLPSGDATVKFDGNSKVRLVPESPHSAGYEWWGNRGDSVDSKLTREFDLSALRTATLKFWTWYDIEDQWDYAYVEASADGGATWRTLAGNYTTKEDPVGNSFGHGFTGQSGHGSRPAWVEETMDLSPYAGRKVLIRFEYVTDEAVHRPGIAIDDISIPELGFQDDVEHDAGWQAEGFARITNTIEQRFLVQAIQSTASGSRVETIPLDDEQDGQIMLRGFGRDLRKATLVISGLTPVTSEPANFRFSVSASP